MNFLDNKFIPKNLDYSRFLGLMDEFLFGYDVFLGICGSALSGKWSKGMDLDFLLILPDEYFHKKLLKLPSFLYQDNYNCVYQGFNKIEFGVIGSYYIDNPLIRVEIYLKSVADNLLNLNVFEINRLKNIPKLNKQEVFFNLNGDTIVRELIVKNNISTTISFINKNNSLFWGMHFERLLLSQNIIDTLDYSSYIQKTRNLINRKVSGKIDPNALFYCSTRNPIINTSEILKCSLK